MNLKTVAAFCLVLLASIAAVHGGEYENEMDYEDNTSNEDETYTDEEPNADEDEALTDEEPAEDEKTGLKDLQGETTALVQQDSEVLKKKAGFCHYGIAVWYKPGYQIRCGCMKCTCQRGGAWYCAYNFFYCPYYYCGSRIYNPKKQLCCCGKVHDKKSHYSCCGYYYYDVRDSKCCKYNTVKPKKAKCPRHKI